MLDFTRGPVMEIRKALGVSAQIRWGNTCATSIDRTCAFTHSTKPSGKTERKFYMSKRLSTSNEFARLTHLIRTREKKERYTAFTFAVLALLSFATLGSTVRANTYIYPNKGQSPNNKIRTNGNATNGPFSKRALIRRRLPKKQLHVTRTSNPTEVTTQVLG